MLGYQPTKLIRTFASDRSGVALVELALSFPLVLFTILALLELSSHALQRQRLSQAALQIADNAGRLGEAGFGGAKRLTEKQITDTLLGGIVQADQLELQKNGRIILSSLETNAQGGQWVHWQRCRGGLPFTSSYGSQGDGASGRSFPGMGPADSRIVATPGHPVMFVEVAYRLKPLAASQLVSRTPISETASMPLRLTRDLSSIIPNEDGSYSRC